MSLNKTHLKIKKYKKRIFAFVSGNFLLSIQKFNFKYSLVFRALQVFQYPK